MDWNIEANRLKAQQLSADGKTHKQIAEIMGTSTRSVSYMFYNWPLKIRKPRNVPLKKGERMLPTGGIVKKVGNVTIHRSY